MSSNASPDTENKSKEGENSFKVEEVHSANSWETANLGDKSRNEKFLRLMGAAKKEHHGRFVIGDKDCKHREKTEEKHVEEELEEQYQHSMDHRLVGGRKGHIGLGFHQEDEEEGKKRTEQEGEGGKKEEEEGEGGKKEEEEGDAKDKEESEESDRKEKGDRKRENLDKLSEHSEEVKKMKFVKSDS